MSLEQLASPIEGGNPVGANCEELIQSQHFDLMSEYLAERALQKGRERVRQAAETSGEDAETIANIAFEIDAGKRRIVGLEGIIKDAAKVSPVNPDSVAAELFDRSVALLAEHGKDLRILPHLAVAQVHREGLAGYADVLDLGAALLRAYPDQIEPQPTPDDPKDFWERDGSITELLTGQKLSTLLGSVVVLDAKQAGRLTVSELTGGDVGDPNVDEVPQSDVDAATEAIGPEAVKLVVAGVAGIADRGAALLAACPTLRLSDTIPDRLARTVARIEARPEALVAPDGESGPGVAPGAGGGELRSHDDAKRMLRDLIRYFERAEPSHPAPLLLRRADRLLGKTFQEIIEDMAPAGVAEVALISGVKAAE